MKKLILELANRRVKEQRGQKFEIFFSANIRRKTDVTIKLCENFFIISKGHLPKHEYLPTFHSQNIKSSRLQKQYTRLDLSYLGI